MQLADFHFDLPSDLIAYHPKENRTESRLLCLSEQGEIVHRTFNQISELLLPNDLLVLNDTKVIPARLFGKKTTGGRIEVLIERLLDDKRVLAQVRASKSPHIGDELLFDLQTKMVVLNKAQQFYELALVDGDKTILQVIEMIGEIPLPPYIRREANSADKLRYQTVYAKYKGSVAAPTAGFHFDEALLKSISNKANIAYLTLHVGAGTFSPVRTDDIRQHKMHSEYLSISASLCDQIRQTKAKGGRVIAVGTTTLRALETASQTGETLPYEGDTNIFIYPGYQFHCVDVLVTNFHLPASSLLMLVCALGGYKNIMHAYQQAVLNNYRFYSYGDAMWVPRAERNC